MSNDDIAKFLDENKKIMESMGEPVMTYYTQLDILNEDLVGKEVVYINRYMLSKEPIDFQKAERGIITSYTPTFVFVRYTGNQYSIATYKENLFLVEVK